METFNNNNNKNNCADYALVKCNNNNNNNTLKANPDDYTLKANPALCITHVSGSPVSSKCTYYKKVQKLKNAQIMHDCSCLLPYG